MPRKNASSSLCSFEYLAWFTDERSEGLPGRIMREDRRTFDNDNYFDGGWQWRFCGYSASRRFCLYPVQHPPPWNSHDEPIDLRGVPKLWNVPASISTGNVPEREGGIAPWLRVLVSSGKRATYYCSSRSNRMLCCCCYPHRSTREPRAADVYRPLVLTRHAIATSVAGIGAYGRGSLP